ncbi:hypothetical protein EYZ11_011468 [Aspergillus tanneri]|uniref:Uncharacterized protein n=1 Tax=Aspergillus tanneri TaxID=1220188 RepID=A0A4S3J2Q0_9EURO|nr:hypothetical protein EYZ11_011468 [Aspergillus tanneri]
MAWWARVPHPQNLKNMAFDICREFDLQCPSEKDGQSHVSGSAKAANPTLVVDNEPNTVATKAYEVPPSHEPSSGYRPDPPTRPASAIGNVFPKTGITRFPRLTIQCLGNKSASEIPPRNLFGHANGDAMDWYTFTHHRTTV